MSRLINADALKQKLGMLGVSNAYDRPSFWYGKDKKDYKVIPTKYHNGYDNALIDVEKAIQELPTIEERKGKWIHGREIWREHIGDAIVGIGYEDWRCSECHTLVKDAASGVLWKYCPWCGAKMERSETESNGNE